MQGSLPAGGLRLCREGVEPSGTRWKVSDYIILLPRTFLSQVGWCSTARSVLSDPVDLIHIRERDLEASALADLVSAVLAATHGTAARVVVNDRLDVALATRADGVHLRGDSIAVDAARRIAPADFSSAVPCTARRPAGAANADYLIAGTVFPSASKAQDHQLLGVERAESHRRRGKTAGAGDRRDCGG